MGTRRRLARLLGQTLNAADDKVLPLLATGQQVAKRKAAKWYDLTAQERQIAQLASSGRSNPEIATRLFISRHTVEYHLAKVFSKLGITSRKQLAGATRRSEMSAPATSPGGPT
jgi:DNA-binding CsgD family transcriptional regulator